MADALADPAVKDKLAGLGADTESLSPETMARFLTGED